MVHQRLPVPILDEFGRRDVLRVTWMRSSVQLRSALATGGGIVHPQFHHQALVQVASPLKHHHRKARDLALSWQLFDILLSSPSQFEETSTPQDGRTDARY